MPRRQEERDTAQEAFDTGLPAYYRGLSVTQRQLVRAPWADGMSATENTTTEAPATAPTAELARPAVTADDNLACQWEKCSDRCPSAEALFDHICEKHVGRKSTNNLNLTCGWASCRTTTVKRDHITSHIRVHVPLKPHKCDFCGKAFKRPQDLKKHVKTHADDSVLLRSPEQHGHSNQGPGPRQGGRAPGGYYDHVPQMHPGQGAPYGHHQATHNGYYAPQQSSSYAPVYYGVNHGADLGQHAAYDTRKRGLDALNEFFGDAKRRQFDSGSYHHVSQRLMALQGIPIGGGGLHEYVSAGPALVSIDGNGGHHSAPMPQHQYALPLPNLRTKNDLMNIDQFLDQMQHTVYDNATNSNATAAAGIHQPGVHYTHTGLNYRSSHSPPQSAMPHSHMGSHHATSSMMASHSSQSNGGTPALTPPSSSVSYTSGHSPVSSHGMSPVSRHSSTASAGYPILPAVTMGYSPHSTAAPASTLGTNFDPDQRRRFSGGMLQRSANSRSGDAMDLSSDGSRTPSPQVTTPRLSTSGTPRIDPALGGVASPTPSDSEESPEEAWLHSARVVEALSKFVKERLSKGEFIDDAGDTKMGGTEAKVEEKSSSVGLYPTLRADDD